MLAMQNRYSGVVFHQYQTTRAVKVLTGLLIHNRYGFKNTAFWHDEELAVLVLIGARYADIVVNFFYRSSPFSTGWDIFIQSRGRVLVLPQRRGQG